MGGTERMLWERNSPSWVLREAPLAAGALLPVFGYILCHIRWPLVHYISCVTGERGTRRVSSLLEVIVRVLST